PFEDPVDRRADRYPERGGDEQAVPGEDERARPSEPLAGQDALRPAAYADQATAAPGGDLAAHDKKAEHDEHQGQGAGGRGVEADGELREDLGREGLVTEDLESPVLGEDHEGH